MLVGRISIILLSSLLPLSLFCDPLTIDGSVTGGADLQVELIVYADLVTSTEVVIAETRIGSDESFKIKTQIPLTAFAYLKIGIQRCEILLEPGKTYQLKISGLLSENLRNKDIAPFQIPALQVEILNPWRFELNGLATDFFSFHDDFLTKNAVALIRQRDANVVKQYITEIYNRFTGIDNAWFNDFLVYKIAYIEMMAKVKSREVLAGQYFLDKPILYDHMAYMDFLAAFFKKYLVTSRLYDRRSLIEALDSPKSQSIMMDMLGKDAILKDLRIRELVLIKGMQDLSATPGFSKKAIVALLEQVQTNSNFSEHKLIAEELSKLLLRQ